MIIFIKSHKLKWLLICNAAIQHTTFVKPVVCWFVLRSCIKVQRYLESKLVDINFIEHQIFSNACIWAKCCKRANQPEGLSYFSVQGWNSVMSYYKCTYLVYLFSICDINKYTFVHLFFMFCEFIVILSKFPIFFPHFYKNKLWNILYWKF